MIIIIAITILAFIAAVIERQLYDRALNKIDLRILVNGTRGKTSVTRLIAASLNAYGIRTYAKTTGSEARWVLPDGSEIDFRKGKPPTVLEQRSFLRMARKNGAQAIVVECMALNRKNQWLMANVLIRQHYTIITNAYVDHLEEIGWTKEETISTLALSIYPKSKLITTEKGFAKYANIYMAPLVDLEYNNDATRTAKENIALVKALARNLNIPEYYVLQGVNKVKPDIGLHDYFTLDDFCIHNAFAANDPMSLLNIIDSRINNEPYILLYNHRFDRPLRLKLLANALNIAKPEFIGVIGDNKNYTSKYFEKILKVKAEKVDNPLEWILSKTDLNIRQVLCAGNIKNEASTFIDELIERNAEYV